jgi:DNA uptake protein ComE-like DNA-binding protein
MDKASIIGDAVNFLQELQKEVEELELAEISSSNLESSEHCCGSEDRMQLGNHEDSGSIIADVTATAGVEDAAAMTAPVVIELCNGGRRTNTAAAAAATAPTAPDSNTNHESSSHQLHLMGPNKKKKILQVGQKHFSHVDICT